MDAGDGDGQTGIVLSNAQIWTMLGIVISLLVTVGGLTLATVRSGFDTLRTETTSLRQVMEVRFDGVDHRLDRMDADIQALTNRVFRDG